MIRGCSQLTALVSRRVAFDNPVKGEAPIGNSPMNMQAPSPRPGDCRLVVPNPAVVSALDEQGSILHRTFPGAASPRPVRLLYICNLTARGLLPSKSWRLSLRHIFLRLWLW
ncbi:hypothetical protein N7510_001661 [Penicillium lagena]|uniref:uncharacterized protein n=1 Tax=Penicillium lagena TaxID=94218 RepID=UPI0025414919|nr:uncharacterized protein N7510_001661 [Penicillium lagena]KAJ5625352.1 hypothetical protein N7510_001661 [Penicillium lagena]